MQEKRRKKGNCSPKASSSVMLHVLEGEGGLGGSSSSLSPTSSPSSPDPRDPRGTASSITMTESWVCAEGWGSGAEEEEPSCSLVKTAKEEEEGERESGLPSGNGESE